MKAKPIISPIVALELACQALNASPEEVESGKRSVQAVEVRALAVVVMHDHDRSLKWIAERLGVPLRTVYNLRAFFGRETLRCTERGMKLEDAYGEVMSRLGDRYHRSGQTYPGVAA